MRVLFPLLLSITLIVSGCAADDGLGGTGLPAPVPWSSPPNGEEDLRCESICERLDYCGVLEGTAAETIEDCIAVCKTWSAGFLKGTAKCNLDADKTCSELTKKCWVPGGKPPPKDHCDGVECEEPDPNTCVGEVHTAYAMKGDCNAGLCFYNSEITDCAAIDMVCDVEFGCIPDPCEDVVKAMHELVITVGRDEAQQEERAVERASRPGRRVTHHQEDPQG